MRQFRSCSAWPLLAPSASVSHRVVMSAHGLSKSRITAFEQCEKRLWLSVHRPEVGDEDADALARYAVGHEVGDIACSLYPTGVMVEAEPDLSAALAKTTQLLGEGFRDPIFEATLQHDGVLVRFDLLWADGQGGWCVAEVKSSARRKDYHLGDLATQVWVAQQNGLTISSAATQAGAKFGGQSVHRL